MGLTMVAATARHHLGLALARLGQYEEGRRVETEALEVFRRLGNRRLEATSLTYLALIEIAAGAPDAGEAAARAALSLSSSRPQPLSQAEAWAILGQALLARGQGAEAREAGQRAVRALAEVGGVDAFESIIRLTWAEALWATGDRKRARVAIELGRARLVRRALRIADKNVRASFLDQVPENARTFACAAAWLGASDG